jgi:predicted molibdopterin-dependent oxidoreductase YjgC
MRRVLVTASRLRAKVRVQARVTDEIALGTCFLPFHWDRDEGFFKAANNLTISARDPCRSSLSLKHVRRGSEELRPSPSRIIDA